MMNYLLVMLFCLSQLVGIAQDSRDTVSVRKVVHSFLNSWNRHDFSDLGTYATDDLTWVFHFGKIVNGRREVQDANQKPHNTFYKTAQVRTLEESITIRFINMDVALVNLIHRVVGTFYPPDGIDRGENRREGGREIKTMIIIRQNGKWLLNHNHTTSIN